MHRVFLNVVIYRLPLGLSVNEPSRSFCPTCKEPIPWYLNIPILSWLMLRGRSACCNTPISVRYWLVEVATALLFGLVAWYFAVDDIITQALLCAWVAAMLATLCTDWEHMVVMPVLMVVAAAAGVLVSLLSPWFTGMRWSRRKGCCSACWARWWDLPSSAWWGGPERSPSAGDTGILMQRRGGSSTRRRGG